MGNEKNPLRRMVGAVSRHPLVSAGIAVVVLGGSGYVFYERGEGNSQPPEPTPSPWGMVTPRMPTPEPETLTVEECLPTDGRKPTVGRSANGEEIIQGIIWVKPGGEVPRRVRPEKDAPVAGVFSEGEELGFECSRPTGGVFFQRVTSNETESGWVAYSLGDAITGKDPNSTPTPKSTSTPTQTSTPTPEATSIPRPPTATQTPVFERRPTSTPAPELRRAASTIALDNKGSEIVNQGRGYAVVVKDEGARDGDGNYCPGGGGGLENCPGKTVVPNGMATENLNYVKRMFAEYGNRPEGGEGKILKIFFYDDPQDFPFWGQERSFPSWYRYAREVDNAIELYIGIKRPVDLGDSYYRGIISRQINFGIANFLNGDHDAVISATTPRKPLPEELQRTIYPGKFSITSTGPNV